MKDIPSSLVGLVLSWGVSTAVLMVLVMYRATLSRAEDDSLYLNKTEKALMAGEQDVLVAKMNRLGRPIKTLALLYATLLVTSAGLWLWSGFKSF